MVDGPLVAWLVFAAQESSFAAQKASGKVPEPTRTIVLMALLGILLVGMLLIVGTMLGAHWVRRQGKFRRGPVVPPDVLPPRPAPPVTESTKRNIANTGDTFTGDDTVSNDDTIVS
jgi:hypothetical protein